MASYAKTSLYPDVPLYGTAPNGKRVAVQFTHDDVLHLGPRIREMLDAGLTIPVAWEHQSRAKPMTQLEWEQFLAEQTRLTCGYITDYEITPNGQLKLMFDVDDPEDAKRVEIIKYVSPEIEHDVMDGSGRIWDGPSITHLAITPRPVMAKQDSVQRIGLSFGSYGRRYKTLRLSLGAAPMADEEYTDDEVDTGEEVETDDAEVDEVEETEIPDEIEEASGASGKLETIIPLLQEFGIDVNPGVTDLDSFIDHLHTALLTKSRVESNDEFEEDGLGDEDDMGEDVAADDLEVPEGASPVMLSLAKKAKRNQKRADVFAKQLLSQQVGKIKHRVSKIGTVRMSLKKDLEQRFSKAKFELDDEGKLKENSFLVYLDGIEAATKQTRLSRGTPRGVEVEADPVSQKKGKPDEYVLSRLTRGAYTPKN